MSRVLRHNARRGNRRRVDEIHHLLICSGATDEHSWVISTQSWPPRRFAPPFERVSVERAQKVSRNSVPVNDDDHRLSLPPPRRGGGERGGGGADLVFFPPPPPQPPPLLKKGGKEGRKIV